VKPSPVAPVSDARTRRSPAGAGARNPLSGSRVPVALADRPTRVILRRLERELTRARQDRLAERSRQALAELSENRRCTCPPERLPGIRLVVADKATGRTSSTR
jgi:hypothetical protein